ncbi:type II secretion system minor pseudopilin GspJ [Bowmanella sp. JS7-9]|uniref:Type II secretion system protein J n=1 Tax=Pseudobowmanella zhangzhouensis TaxID=1537679 RepID=A0ABW1XJ06_9ALTE|nr:type II secretion system minor pseudopilin GspJ [Bowmanella sp. JS7-9]TBX20898.1 hypothetical protein TK45_14135 [Bowmanella sp. JS7-9]
MSRGFTLIEALVAIAIFALIGLGAYTVEKNVLDSNEVSSVQFEQLVALQRAMLTIEQDLRQVVPRSMQLDDNTRVQGIVISDDLLGSQADAIAFVRAGRYNPNLMLPRSTVQPVAYRLYDNQLQRLSSNYVDNVSGHEPKVKVLLSDIEDFQVDAITADDKTESNWPPGALPAAVRLTIVSQTFGEIVREFNLVDNP